MIENKRFTIVDEQFISYYGGTGYKISNGECGFWLWHGKEESQKVCDKLNNIFDENEQLKFQLNDCLNHKLFSRRELEKENEQLKQRNDRQAKRLAELYELMAKKDWESLTEIIDDLCSCEEQLRREWKCYE